MGIRLSSGSRRPQSPKGLPLHLLNRFLIIKTHVFYKFYAANKPCHFALRSLSRTESRIGIVGAGISEIARLLVPVFQWLTGHQVTGLVIIFHIC